MTATTSTLVASTYYPTEADGLKFRVLGTTQGHMLPDGFPNSLDSPLAWTKSQMQAQEKDWLIHLSFEELKSIDDALREFQGCFPGHKFPLEEHLTYTPSVIA